MKEKTADSIPHYPKKSERKRLKGDLLYLFSDLERNIIYPVFAQKYAHLKTINDFLDADLFERFNGITESLIGKKYITSEQEDILSQVPYLYLDAIVKWLDSDDSIKIVLD